MAILLGLCVGSYVTSIPTSCYRGFLYQLPAVFVSQSVIMSTFDLQANELGGGGEIEEYDMAGDAQPSHPPLGCPPSSWSVLF